MGLVESIKYDCGGIQEKAVETNHEIVEDGSWRLANLYLQIWCFAPVQEKNHPLDLLNEFYNEKYVTNFFFFNARVILDALMPSCVPFSARAVVGLGANLLRPVHECSNIVLYCIVLYMIYFKFSFYWKILSHPRPHIAAIICGDATATALYRSTDSNTSCSFSSLPMHLPDTRSTILLIPTACYSITR